MTDTRSRRTLAVALALGGVAALACACSSSSDPAPALPASSQTGPAVSGTSSLTGPAVDGLATYRAMWADVVAANQTSNYQAPGLVDHLAGPALSTLTTNMAAEKQQGIITLGQPVLHPVVISTSANSVTIQDCVDDTGWLQYVAATHKLVNSIPGGDRATTAIVTDDSGVWKVTEMDSGSDGSCHAP